ncbi:MAG: 50S ribosomal protein L11 methyltransferase [Oscillospiraceae bacterium]|nr:50S ribosomal protein L11 methyltransferase [Oscillospiraceae bacterium]
MDWTEIKITVNADDVDRAGDIAQMVVPYGIYIEDYRTLEQEAWEIAGIDLIDEDLLAKDRTKGIVHIYISPEENPAEAVSFLTERYTAEGIDAEIDKTACKNEDWENNWKKYFKPMPIGERLLIRPVWEQEYDAGNRAVLHLEPGLAFGSGTHDTTRLCLETLEKYANPGKTVLDIGCGSGILSVASLLLGADKALGVDIDALAVKTARENGRTNGFDEPRFTVLQGSTTDKVTGRYDIIVANIVADIIINLCRDVKNFMNPGAVFITSGIIVPREDDVLRAFEENGLAVKARHESGGWLCFEAVVK